MPIASMIRSPFPPWVGFAVVNETDMGDFRLFPEEEALLSPRAVEARRKSFRMGRAACRRALQNAGIASPPPVLRGPMDAPLWPEGYLGALTHSSSVAVSAVCPANRASGIGVDLEKATRNITEGAHKLVCNDPELAWVRSGGEETQCRFTMIFSAKEAAYKAFFPTARRYLDFKIVTLTWVPDRSLFLAVLQEEITQAYPSGYRFEIACSLLEDHVFTSMVLP